MQRTSQDNEECSYFAPEFQGMSARVQTAWNVFRNVSESVQFPYLDSESQEQRGAVLTVFISCLPIKTGGHRGHVLCRGQPVIDGTRIGAQYNS